MKIIIQPEITKSELKKIAKYNKIVKANGYCPWVTVRQSDTFGQGQVIYSTLTDREHHLLSRGERAPFFKFESNPLVVDILEQYPLPIHQTMSIAEKLNILHPGKYLEREKNGGRVPAVTMTSDLVLVFKNTDGSMFLKVYSSKYASALDKKIEGPIKVSRTNKKIEIEREFWRTQKVPFQVVTEKNFNANEIYNLEFLREALEYPELLNVSEDVHDIVLIRFNHYIVTAPFKTFQEVIKSISVDIQIDEFQCLCLIQHAIFTKKIRLNLFEKIEMFRPLQNTTGGSRYVA